MPPNSSRIARTLAMQARSLREALTDPRWDDDAVQLVVAGLYAARLLTGARGGLSRDTVLDVISSRESLLHRTLCHALSPKAPIAISSAVDGVLDTLAALDPVDGGADLLDFYEPFLHAYAPHTRRAHGVYFTPSVLAAYAVRRVDDVLEQELGVEHGLAASGTVESDLPRVLDPACGVGAFLTAVIRHVSAKVRERCRARHVSERDAREVWQRHVREQLLPRLAGFELMPVTHALARLQVRLALAATGYTLTDDDTLGVHCVDALDLAANESMGTLAAANVLIGNPPYARGGACSDPAWVELMAPYKAPLRGEKNLQPLSDDYLRFLRLAEHALTKQSRGVAALVLSSTLLHGRLSRGVRASLGATFARTDVLDLGGNSKRGARDAARVRDENVFPIAQGVALLVMRRGPGLAAQPPCYSKLTGRRAAKLDALARGAIGCQALELPEPGAPWLPHVPVPREYLAFVALDELFSWHSIAAKPGDDALLVSFAAEGLVERIEARRSELRRHPERAHTEASRRLRDFEGSLSASHVVPYAYRPLDTRFVYDDPRLWTRPVRRLRPLVDGQRLLLTTRLAQDAAFAHVFATRLLPDVIFLSSKSAVNCFVFPESALEVEHASHVLQRPVERARLFAYVYAWLHAPVYRAHYASALERGVPRVPLTRSHEAFGALADRGERLLALHLGEADVSTSPTPRWLSEADGPVQLAALARAPVVEPGGGLRIGVNRDAAFTNVDPAAWQFRVGGHQVCHKWLLDRARAGRALDATDVARYSDVVRISVATIEAMRELDQLVAEVIPELGCGSRSA